MMTPSGYIDAFSTSFTWLAGRAYQLAIEKGHHDREWTELQLMDRIQEEIDEATEAVLQGTQSDKIPGFTGLEEELADVVLIIMGIAEHLHLDLAEAILAKYAYNQTRVYSKGKTMRNFWHAFIVAFLVVSILGSIWLLWIR